MEKDFANVSPMSWEDLIAILNDRFLSPAAHLMARNSLENIYQFEHEKIINYIERVDNIIKVAFPDRNIPTIVQSRENTRESALSIKLELSIKL